MLCDRKLYGSLNFYVEQSFAHEWRRLEIICLWFRLRKDENNSDMDARQNRRFSSGVKQPILETGQNRRF